MAAYIEEVNATQRAFAIERQRASRVYERARTNPRGLAVNLADLDRSAKELRRFDVRMRALEPPPDARSLDRKLVALTAAEAGFAADVARLGRFLRLLSIERSRVALASRALRSELAAARNTGEQAAAFDRFWTDLATVGRPLARGPVPTSLKPIKAQELGRLAALTASARSLAASLRAGSAAKTAAQARVFAIAAGGGGNAVERRAIIAFDGEARRINVLRRAVANEHARLERVLQ